MPRHRHFIVTINNPVETLAEHESTFRHLGATAAAFQLEKGDSGTPHIQAYLAFPSAKTIASLSAKLKRAHIEVCANPLRSWEYCTKEDTRLEGPITFGAAPKPRKNVKGDTAAFNKLCLEAGPESMVESGQLSLKEYAKVKKSIQLYKLHADCPVAVGEIRNAWFHGDPGVGKSRGCRDVYPGLYNKPINKWWDGYQGESVVLLDDFGPEHKVLAHYLKQWADHYPFTAETKGSSSKLRPDRILVTSNYHPRDIWTDDQVLLAAIDRRFTVLEITAPGQVTEYLQQTDPSIYRGPACGDNRG